MKPPRSPAETKTKAEARIGAGVVDEHRRPKQLISHSDKLVHCSTSAEFLHQQAGDSNLSPPANELQDTG